MEREGKRGEGTKWRIDDLTDQATKHVIILALYYPESEYSR